MENPTKEFYPLQLVKTKVSNNEVLLSKERYITLLAISLGFKMSYGETDLAKLSRAIGEKLQELSNYEEFKYDQEYLDHVTNSLQSICELLELIRQPEYSWANLWSDAMKETK